MLVAFLSASQDIVIDAYRVEILAEEQQGPGAGMIQTGYRIGMLISGAGALMIAGAYSGSRPMPAWQRLLGLAMLVFLFAPEPVGASGNHKSLNPRSRRSYSGNGWRPR